VNGEALIARLSPAWTSETSSDAEHWSEANRAWGQCAVTALIVQDMFGGELLRSKVENISHYWNRLPSGEEIDLTRQQFGETVVLQGIETRTREYVLGFPDTKRRYKALLRRLARDAGAKVVLRP
jgi:hypothetical protein